MDSNNVISITNNLDSLNEDFNKWNHMSLIDKEVSDKVCLESYKCTNRELYNKMKSSILFGKKLDIDNVAVTESYDYENIDRKDLIMRISLVKNMNNDPTVALLYPYDPELFKDETYKNNYIEEFKYLYNKFLSLSYKYQKFSNAYSIQIFGYNVRSMYDLILPDIDSNSNSTEDIILVPCRNYVDSDESSLDESMNDYFLDKNILELYKFKICSCTDSDSRGITEGYSVNSIISDINQYTLSEKSNYSLKSSFLPFFTINEYNSIVDNSNEILEGYDINNIDDNYKYYMSICELYNKFKADKSNTILENTLLSLGWNPAVDPHNNDNIKKIKEKHERYFNNHSCHVIDLSDYDFINKNKTLYESSNTLNNMYKELDLYPVYLVLSYTNTFFGKVIKRVKSSTFTHAGLSLDSNLNQILTFMFNDKNNKGFMVESLDKYIETYEDAKISVLCFFVDNNTKLKLEDSINYFTNNKNKTSYNFKNLLNILRNKAKDNDPENLCMVCSQFVDTILKLANIDLTHKSSNLVIPQDLNDIKHHRVYKLYNGLGKKYDEMKVEAKIQAILLQYNPEDIRYTDFVKEVYTSTSNLLSHRYNITDNDKANRYLSEFYRYVLPKY